MIKSFQAYFELTADQINELYNYVTDDGKKRITFTDFKDLIFFLEENRRNQEQKMIEITVTPNQYVFIEENIVELSSIKDKEAFIDYVRNASPSYERLEDNLSDELLNNLFYMVTDYYGNESTPNPQILLSYINVTEPNFEAAEPVSRNTDVADQNSRAVEMIKSHLESFIVDLNVIKKKDPSESVYETFKNFLKLSDNVNSEVG